MPTMLDVLDTWVAELRGKLEQSQQLNGESIQLLDELRAALRSKDFPPEGWRSLLTRMFGMAGKGQQLQTEISELNGRNPALFIASKLELQPTPGFSPGDHIMVDYGSFQHHGIYLGNRLVIHNSMKAGGVCPTTLPEFRDGRTAHLILYSSSRCDPADKVMRRALSCLGNPYDLWSDNCEHFAVWCKTGRRESEQAASGAPVASACVAAVIGAVVSLIILWCMGEIGFSDPGTLTGLKQIGFGKNYVGAFVLFFSPPPSRRVLAAMWAGCIGVPRTY